MDSLATRVRKARERKSLSQSELARQIGVTPQAIQAIEAGHVDRPRHIVRLAQALDTSPQFLEDGDEDVYLFSETAVRAAVEMAVKAGLLRGTTPAEAADLVLSLAIAQERSRRRHAPE